MVRTPITCAWVMVTRRFSVGLGRMEIRSSSDDSQFMALSAKSRLPLKLMKEFAAQDALPITTNRPCEFSLPVLYEPAAAIASGPFLFFGSLGSMFGESSLLVAKLVSEDENNFSTVVFPALLMSSERDSGKPVAEPFISFTMACVL